VSGVIGGFAWFFSRLFSCFVWLCFSGSGHFFFFFFFCGGCPWAAVDQYLLAVQTKYYLPLPLRSTPRLDIE